MVGFAKEGRKGGSKKKVQGVIKYCVFWKNLKYIPDSGLSVFPLGVSCVHNGRSNTSTAAELVQKKSQHFKEKNEKKHYT